MSLRFRGGSIRSFYGFLLYIYIYIYIYINFATKKNFKLNVGGPSETGRGKNRPFHNPPGVRYKYLEGSINTSTYPHLRPPIHFFSSRLSLP